MAKAGIRRMGTSERQGRETASDEQPIPFMRAGAGKGNFPSASACCPDAYSTAIRAVGPSVASPDVPHRARMN